MFPQGILTYQTYTFHDDHEHLPRILRRTSMSIAQYSFSENPHTRREFRPHPLFFTPSFHLVRYSHREGERGLWCGQCLRRYIISATVFVWNVVLPELLQNILPRSLGFMIHSVVMPRSTCHDFHQAFSSSPRPGVDRLWFTVARFNHHFCIHEPKHALCFEPEAALVPKKTAETRAGGGREGSGKFLKASHKTRFSMNRSYATPSTDKSLICDSYGLHNRTQHADIIICGGFYWYTDWRLDKQASAENQIKDTREHAHTSNLGRHSRAHFQAVCNLTNRHTCFPVDNFDDHTTSAFAIVFEAAVPIAFHRLPCPRIITSVKDNFPLSLWSNVGPVVSFLNVFSVDMFHETVNVRRPSLSTMSVTSFELVRFVFWTCPILPLYFCSREYSPLIHLHVTSLCPHSCIVGPSTRVWIVVSPSPNFLGVLSSTFFPMPLLLFDVQWKVSFC